MESEIFNILEKFNQGFLILTSYFMMLCTDWLNIDAELVRNDLGFTM